jgi:class 3 adenylate cyclase
MGLSELESPRNQAAERQWLHAESLTHALKQRTLALLDSNGATALMAVATFWSLMANDIRVAAQLSMDHDRNFAIVTSICFFLFSTEIALSLFARPRYYRSVYLPFDLVATGTLIVEMDWLLASSGGRGSSAGGIAEATSTVRLLRVVRLVRMFRIVKLLEIVNFKKAASSDSELRSSASAPGSWQDNPSEVGRLLQETITLQIVVGVLIMLVVFPFLTLISLKSRIDYEHDAVEHLDELLHAQLRAGVHESDRRAFELLLRDSQKHLHLTYFEGFDGSIIFRDDSAIPPRVRDVEYELIAGGIECASAGACSLGGFLIKVDLVYEARFSLGLLGFVILLLGAGVVVFQQVSMKYCIAPIEKLFAIVSAFSDDPMRRLESFGDDELDELNELEQSIRKIAQLLQVGIGLAGRDTIARVLRTTTGEINPIEVGRKVNCLFGFCDIRQFTDATECLQEEVMVFTNSVGHIVHHAVHDCGGFANKNIGDAFLVAWTSDELEKNIRHAKSLERGIAADGAGADGALAQRSTWVPTVGDKSMAAFIRLTICVRGATHITKLVQNPMLQRRLPGYTVRLGCGLHVGWAIEGALGSQKKIDATYLSPATNIAMGLEGATKQYGNLLLISEQTYQLCSPFVRSLLRRIDRVYASAGAEPFDLYTYDCPTSLAVHPDEAESKAMLAHVFDYPLAISAEFRAGFEQALVLYLKVSELSSPAPWRGMERPARARPSDASPHRECHRVSPARRHACAGQMARCQARV